MAEYSAEAYVTMADSLLDRAGAGDLVTAVRGVGYALLAQHRQREEWAREALNILCGAKESTDG